LLICRNANIWTPACAGVTVFIGAACCLASSHATAQTNYPSKPVRLIVAAGPGGSGDLLGRALAQKLTELWGQQVVIDNRPGAGTVIGTALAAKSAPDGYTLFQANAAHTINPSLLRELPYDTQRAFVPVTLSAELPNVLVLHPSVPANTVKELIALLQSRPGQFNFASSGIGNATHLAAELFRSQTHTQMVHVPYKSGGFALTGVISAQVQIYFATLPSALPHINSGRLRALAVTTIRRSSAAPQLPTMHEAGVTGYEVTSWYGILVPAGTPSAIVAKLNRDIVATLRDPQVRSQIAAQGADPVGNRSDEFAAFISRELVKWARLIKEANISAEPGA
jgi:tripartite-type tricarboxylate transporter receptor subunit TctC